MATADNVRDSLLAALAEADPQPMGELEFLRRQEIRAARDQGLSAPQFRTVLEMRLYGPPVDVHDLPASTAGLIIAKAASMIEAASMKVKQFKGAAKVYMSPIVTPGSTVITLFGEPVEQSVDDQDLGDPIVTPTHLDRSMALIFDALNGLADTDADARAAAVDIDRDLGERIYQFTEALVKEDLSIDIRWTPVDGRERVAQVAKPKAEHIAAVLNKPSRTVDAITDRGVLKVISTDGAIKVAVSNRRWHSVEMMVPADKLESLRGLWGKEVTIRYQRIVTRLPQRATNDIEFEFVSISEGLLPDEGTGVQTSIDA